MLNAITPHARPVDLPEDHPPVLIVVVDTEEEFDWHAPLDRGATAVTAIAEIGRVQEIFDEFEVRPTYVVDYPIASSALGVRVLGEMARDGRATIGAHLHSWVNPPFEEPVNSRTSYQGNLTPELEREKLARLTERIADAFGERPVVHKAGRYGYGPATGRWLRELGFLVDASASPPFGFVADGGPDYADASSRPAWLDEEEHLLELPATGGFVGPCRRYGRGLQSAAARPFGRALKLGSVLSRGRLLDRLRLSPEEHELGPLRRLTAALLADGQRVFTMSFHSPSAKIGCTPYVRDADDLRRFLGSIRGYLTYFLREAGGVAMDHRSLREHLRRHGRRVVA